MAEQKKSGCMGAIIALVIIGVLLFVGLIVAFYAAKDRKMEYAEESAQARAAAATTLVFEEDDLPRFPFPKAGAPITREQFVAHVIDDSATDLSKDSFRDVANGAPVSWKLETNDISERNGEIQGHFTLPWEIRRRNSSRGSSVSVRANFTEESRQALLNLRRGDWVTVSGELAIENNSATINNARLGGSPLPAESP